MTERATIRERLQAYGETALTNDELIAIMTRTDTATARNILQRAGSLQALAKMSLQELKHIMTPSAAENIKSALDLARRINKANAPQYDVIRSPEDIHMYIADSLRYEQIEKFITIFLNTKNRIICHEVISIGSLNQTIVHPREVFNRAIAHRASSIIVCHNHPSGDPTPSQEDIEMTKRLAEAGRIIGIDLLDHVIIADSFVSLKTIGLM